MTAATSQLLLTALQDALGPHAVEVWSDHQPQDLRIAHPLNGRPGGHPLAWLRPTNAAQCVQVVQLARQFGARLVPVGEATAFWDNLRLDGALLVDTRSLQGPIVVDAVRRTVQAPAGANLWAIDRAAREAGLCLAARTDADGTTPVATLLAVGTTAGLGLGRVLPVDQIVGAEVVLGTGELVRLGASLRLGGVGSKHGLPDALSLLTSAEGQSALVVAVVLALAVARPEAVARLQYTEVTPDLLVQTALLGRDAIAEGEIDSWRLEVYRQEGRQHGELLIRTLSPRGVPGDALAAAHLWATAAARLGWALQDVSAVSEAARQGTLPEYASLWSIPHGAHRERLGGLALTGIEVSVSYGAELAAAVARLDELAAGWSAQGLPSTRVALYTASHVVSVGASALHARDLATCERCRAPLPAMRGYLLALGGVPYRCGAEWAEALAQADPVGVAVGARLHAALDPDGVVSPRGVPAAGPT